MTIHIDRFGTKSTAGRKDDATLLEMTASVSAVSSWDVARFAGWQTCPPPVALWSTLPQKAAPKKPPTASATIRKQFDV